MCGGRIEEEGLDLLFGGVVVEDLETGGEIGTGDRM
jgi:hypothetical protein